MLAYAHNPLGFARDILGFEPDEQQARILDPTIKKLILCCTRGWGKTETTAVRAVWQLTMRPGSLVLVVSETAEKAAELVLRVGRYLEKAGHKLSPDPLRKHGYCLPNGSRILPLPSRHGAVRGFPADLVIIDESACVADKVWIALSGTRAATFAKSSIILMSTPGACAGFFFEVWSNGDPTWTRIKVPATECKRIAPEFLEQMRREMHPDDFRREFMAEFAQTRTQLFQVDGYLKGIRRDIPRFDTETVYALSEKPYLGAHALLSNGQRVPANGFYVGVDLGQARDHSTFAIVEYRLEATGRSDAMSLAPFYNTEFRLRHLQRFPLETPYTDIADILVKLVEHTELRKRATLVIDASGVGRGFLDILRRRKVSATIRGVQFTGGTQITESAGVTNVPKSDFILALDMLLRRGALLIAADCLELDAFRKELITFERVRSGSGKWSYTGKTQGTDDLIVAVALAVGYACHLHPPPGLWEGLDRF